MMSQGILFLFRRILPHDPGFLVLVKCWLAALRVNRDDVAHLGVPFHEITLCDDLLAPSAFTVLAGGQCSRH